MIEIGKEYLFNNGDKVKVLAGEINSTGDKIYACKVLESSKLIWSDSNSLEEVKTFSKGLLEEVRFELLKMQQDSSYQGIVIAEKSILSSLQKELRKMCTSEIALTTKGHMMHRDGGRLWLRCEDDICVNRLQRLTFTTCIIDKSIFNHCEWDTIPFMVSRTRGESKYHNKVTIV